MSSCGRNIFWTTSADNRLSGAGQVFICEAAMGVLPERNSMTGSLVRVCMMPSATAAPSFALAALERDWQAQPCACQQFLGQEVGAHGLPLS